MLYYGYGPWQVLSITMSVICVESRVLVLS